MRIRRLLKWVLAGLMAGLLVCVAAAVWLLQSQAGALWLVQRSGEAGGGELTIASVQGSLGSGLVLTGVGYELAGLEVETERLEMTVSPTVSPMGLRVKSFEAEETELTLSGTGNAAPASLAEILASLDLPVTVVMDDVQLIRLRVNDAERRLLLDVNRISAAGRWHQRIEIEHLDIVTTLGKAGLYGSVGLRPPFGHRLNVRGNLRESDGPLSLADFRLSLSGDAQRSELRLSNDTFGVDLAGYLVRPFDELSFELDGRAERINSRNGTKTRFAATDWTVKLQGAPQDYRLSSSLSLELPNVPVMHLSLRGRGGRTGFELEQLEADAGFLELRGAGAVDWTAQPGVDASLQVLSFYPNAWWVTWPQNLPVTGRVVVRAETGAYRIPEFHLGVEGTDMRIEGHGLYDHQTGVVDATIAWRQLAWPPSAGTMQLHSRQGEFMVTGAPDAWRFEGGMLLDTPAYPGGQFKLNGHGGLDSADVVIVSGGVLGGNVAGEVSFEWGNALRWNGELEVRQLDLGAVSSDFPARVNAKLQLAHDAAGQHLHVNIDSLDGTFRAQTFEGSGAIDLEAGRFTFRNLEIRTGDSAISLDGSSAGSSGLAFTIDVQRPSWMAEALGGEFWGSGHLLPDAAYAWKQLDLQGKDLKWAQLRVDGFSASSGPVNTDGSNRLDISVNGLSFRGFGLQSVQGRLDGDNDNMSLHLKARESGLALDLRLAGAPVRWRDVLREGWTGNLTSLDIELDEEPPAALKNVTDVFASGDEFRLDPACLELPGPELLRPGAFCLESAWHAERGFEVSATLSEFPLNFSRLFIDHRLQFTQNLDGEVSWSLSAGGLPSGQAAVRVSPGYFGELDGDGDRVETAEGFFGFELDGGNLTSGRIDLPLPGVGKIDFNYTVSGLVLDGTGKLDGHARVDLEDMSILEFLASGLDRIGGRMQADLWLGGETLNPTLDGSFSFKDGHVDLPALGLRLHQCHFDGMVESNDSISLQGGFKAGDGEGRFTMSGEFRDWLAPRLDFSLAGTSLALLNTPELRVEADTDLALGLEDGVWQVDGNAVVQKARIAPLTSISNKVSQSPDVKIVNGVLPFEEPRATERPANLNGTIDILLGDAVRVEANVASVQLSGGVALTWSGDLRPRASGSVLVNGDLSVFGPTLHVSNGLVRFPGGDVSNPQLDIRAQRNIFGNTHIHAAGVGITGTARRPVIAAYTDPRTTEQRAWALLITGNDVEHGQGIGAFEVGTYIAPRLYLSYGIGLFDNESVVSARYDLRRRLGVKLSSGQRESGVDISYTVER